MTWPYLDVSTPYGIAHRGGDTGPPENTVAAFERAVELGYLHLETDVHRSADGVLVAFHDDNLSRLVGHEAEIRDLPWPEIKELDLGNGHHIPQLEDLFTRFPTSRFNIDPKSDEAVDPLAEMILRFDMVDRVCIGSFSEKRIRRIRNLIGPELCTSPGPAGVVKVLGAALFRPGWRSPYGCLQVPTRAYGIRLDRPRLIKRVQSLGMQVHFWTINDGDEMRRLLAAGADALVSDEIETLLTVLSQSGDLEVGS